MSWPTRMNVLYVLRSDDVLVGVELGICSRDLANTRLIKLDQRAQHAVHQHTK